MTSISSPASLTSIKTLLRSKDIVLALSLVMIVGMLILPLPSSLVDLLVALNIAISIGVLLMSMYISQPLDFSVFPTVLLLITLLRLGINIAASRLILLNGDAGKVIDTFGTLVVGGNYVVGMVIFLMLMIIQFVVINSGAGRVAEVAARFTLDAMPGKQLAIDADLNAGLIDENQARKRRRTIEAEADFYGAMDGSSKFVRGDAIATIIILVVNIIGGIFIGVLQRGQPIMTALQTYTLLTIGAGLAVQIPSLLVSAASGLIVTRSTSESSLATEMFGQLSNFNVLTIGAVMILLLGLVPGLPKLPFFLIAAGLGAGAYLVHRGEAAPKAVEEVLARPTAAEPETPEDMMQMVVVDPIELEIGYGLISLIDDDNPENLLRRIISMRRQLMTELGLVVPVVRIRDNLLLEPQAYRVKVRGQEVAGGSVMLDCMLAIPGSDTQGKIPGIETTEPAFGLPAYWINASEQVRAEIMGCTVVNSISVLTTHLTELIRSYASDLLTRQTVQEMLGQLRQKAPASVEGVVPDLLSLGELQAVLRNLLRERVPIRDLSGILEVLANTAGMTRDVNILSEAVRQSMAKTICAQYRDQTSFLHVFTFSPQLEAALRGFLAPAENGPGFQMDALLAQKMLARTGELMESMASSGFMPVLLCPRELRLAFRRLVEPSLPNLVVLAYSEISQGTRVKSHGMVDVN